MRPLRIGSLRRWLEARRSTMQFKLRSCKLCPLARYLGNSPGNINVSVTGTEVKTHGSRRTIPLPVWAKAFIREVDRLPGHQISPGIALKALLTSGYQA